MVGFNKDNNKGKKMRFIIKVKDGEYCVLNRKKND